jgi:hypothetical protein
LSVQSFPQLVLAKAFFCLFSSRTQSGLPDGMFSNQKYQFG